MTIDEIYINESIRIRKTYLKNLLKIVESEEEIKNNVKHIEDIKKEIDRYKEEDINIDEKKISSTILEINKNIDIIKKNIMPYSDSIKKLDEDQRILYNNIKDKYPGISREEIQSQILPHIIPIDNQFRKENAKLYEKIMNKEE
ncbi:MAG: hypothetical protein ACOC3Z_01660 [Nanoarchaeota archaeon]